MYDFDAVVVGARCAGAATAMLLARSGARVLLLDRARPGLDTLSTHALQPGGVLQLLRWGLLDGIAATTPAITGLDVHYGDTVESTEMRGALFAPRRTVLDPLLVAAAEDAGATVRTEVDVVDLRREGGRVAGVVARHRGGETFEVRAPLVIGADGRRSTVARLADAPVVRRGRFSSAFVYGYWPSAADRFELFFRPGVSAGIIPTNDGLACVWAGLPTSRFTGGVEAVFTRVVAEAAPQALPLVAGERSGRLRGFPGMPAYLRRATGPGWALVGDAGFVKDPVTAHGITDALRDAELLARAVVTGGPAAYETVRDALAHRLIDVSDAIAGYGWSLDELRELRRTETGTVLAEVDVLRALDTPALPAAA